MFDGAKAGVAETHLCNCCSLDGYTAAAAKVDDVVSDVDRVNTGRLSMSGTRAFSYRGLNSQHLRFRRPAGRAKSRKRSRGFLEKSHIEDKSCP